MSSLPFVLIHSPLVGSLTWKSTAIYIREQGYDVYVPELIHSVEENGAFWEQEVNGIDLSIDDAIFVGHSGAGALVYPQFYGVTTAQAARLTGVA